jgi:hypothetical protein
VQRQVVKGMIVIDMSGISFSTLYHIGIIKQVADAVARRNEAPCPPCAILGASITPPFVAQVMGIGTAVFPELTSKVFLINAPWAAVKGWVRRGNGYHGMRCSAQC